MDYGFAAFPSILPHARADSRGSVMRDGRAGADRNPADAGEAADGGASNLAEHIPTKRRAAPACPAGRPIASGAVSAGVPDSQNHARWQHVPWQTDRAEAPAAAVAAATSASAAGGGEAR